jgi:hypothetical protein
LSSTIPKLRSWAKIGFEGDSPSPKCCLFIPCPFSRDKTGTRINWTICLTVVGPICIWKATST